MEARLIELETKVAFQDETIEQLNQVITQQQQQIDRFNEQLEMIKRQLQASQPSPLASLSEETPPPHY